MATNKERISGSVNPKAVENESLNAVGADAFSMVTASSLWFAETLEVAKVDAHDKMESVIFAALQSSGADGDLSVCGLSGLDDLDIKTRAESAPAALLECPCAAPLVDVEFDANFCEFSNSPEDNTEASNMFEILSLVDDGDDTLSCAPSSSDTIVCLPDDTVSEKTLTEADSDIESFDEDALAKWAESLRKAAQIDDGLLASPDALVSAAHSEWLDEYELETPAESLKIAIQFNKSLYGIFSESQSRTAPAVEEFGIIDQVEFFVDNQTGYLNFIDYSKALALASISILNPLAKPFADINPSFPLISGNRLLATGCDVLEPFDTTEPHRCNMEPHPHWTQSNMHWTETESFVMAAPGAINESLDSTGDVLDLVSRGTTSAESMTGIVQCNIASLDIETAADVEALEDFTSDRSLAYDEVFDICSHLQFFSTLNPYAMPFDIAHPGKWRSSVKDSYYSDTSTDVFDMTSHVLSTTSIDSVGEELMIVASESKIATDLVGHTSSFDSVHSFGDNYGITPSSEAVCEETNLEHLDGAVSVIKSQSWILDLEGSSAEDAPFLSEEDPVASAESSENDGGDDNTVPAITTEDEENEMENELYHGDDTTLPVEEESTLTATVPFSDIEILPTPEEPLRLDVHQSESAETFDDTNTKDASLWRNWKPNKRDSSSEIPHADELPRCVYSASEMMRIGDMAQQYSNVASPWNYYTESKDFLDKLKKFNIYRDPKDVLCRDEEQTPSSQE